MSKKNACETPLMKVLLDFQSNILIPVRGVMRSLTVGLVTKSCLQLSTIDSTSTQVLNKPLTCLLRAFWPRTSTAL